VILTYSDQVPLGRGTGGVWVDRLGGKDLPDTSTIASAHLAGSRCCGLRFVGPTSQTHEGAMKLDVVAETFLERLALRARLVPRPFLQTVLARGWPERST
jgi:hypothetical protein